MDDLAEAAVFCQERWQTATEDSTFLNVGTGVDLPIRELAELVARSVGFEGRIAWDSSKPDGTPRNPPCWT